MSEGGGGRMGRREEVGGWEGALPRGRYSRMVGGKP